MAFAARLAGLRGEAGVGLRVSAAESTSSMLSTCVMRMSLITFLGTSSRSLAFFFGMIIVLTVLFMPRGIGGFIDDWLVRRRFKAIREASAVRLKAGSG